MRLVDHCIRHKLPYVLIEKHEEAVDDLLRRSEPVIVDDARSRDALPSANIAAAKRVIVASNDIETALIVTKNAR
ncbi:MAG: NAD-binding protein, partial [Elusimicrobia bacterium]|nr:NAD-binding protein [Elusimicrobiota bacterium]